MSTDPPAGIDPDTWAKATRAGVETYALSLYSHPEAVPDTTRAAAEAVLSGALCAALQVLGSSEVEYGRKHPTEPDDMMTGGYSALPAWHQVSLMPWYQRTVTRIVGPWTPVEVTDG